MTKGIYGVHDRLTGYQLIFFEDNDATAQRFFSATYATAPQKFKDDMELWHLGLFDTKTGDIEVDEKYFLMNFGDE